jgi:hypothetical protein
VTTVPKRKTMAAAFRSRISSAKARNRPYDYDDLVAAIELLAALSGWVERLEGATERAFLRRNPSVGSMLDAACAYASGSSVTNELMADISMIGREIRSQRTKEGLAHARINGTRSGKPIGRPRRLNEEFVARVRELAASGQSSRQIAVILNVPRRTVRRALEGQAKIASSGIQ